MKFGHAQYSNNLQWSYEEVEVRDISLTYVHPSASRRTQFGGTSYGGSGGVKLRTEGMG